jgi:hypothetical protein
VSKDVLLHGLWGVLSVILLTGTGFLVSRVWALDTDRAASNVLVQKNEELATAHLRAISEELADIKCEIRRLNEKLDKMGAK